MVVLSFLIVIMIVQGALQRCRARAYSSEHFPLYWIMSGNFFVVVFSSDGCSVCWHFRKVVFRESLIIINFVIISVLNSGKSGRVFLVMQMKYSYSHHIKNQKNSWKTKCWGMPP